MRGVLMLLNRLFCINRKSLLVDVNIDKIGGGNPIVAVGMHSYVNSAKLYCWKSGHELSIGNYCSLAENISFILGGEHDTNWVSTYPFIEKWKIENMDTKVTKKSKGNIHIESDVWIGHGAIILSGTTIGVGSVIGAGAVVRGNIPPYSIAVGMPAKVIKKRFSDEICFELLSTKWWTFNKEKLMSIIQYIDNPVTFINAIKEIDGYN
jgi:acetyltransferase-like isoleucine patch superfamily enzyme